MEWFEGRLEIIRRKKIRNIIILISLKMNKKPPCSTPTPHEKEDKATIVAALLFQQKFILQRKEMKLYFLKLFDLQNRILSSKQETFSGCEGKDAREIYFTLHPSKWQWTFDAQETTAEAESVLTLIDHLSSCPFVSLLKNESIARFVPSMVRFDEKKISLDLGGMIKLVDASLKIRWSGSLELTSLGSYQSSLSKSA
jgi:hypothetical protein